VCVCVCVCVRACVCVRVPVGESYDRRNVATPVAFQTTWILSYTAVLTTNLCHSLPGTAVTSSWAQHSVRTAQHCKPTCHSCLLLPVVTMTQNMNTLWVK